MKKFIITGTQRTGSSALAESIAFSQSICCGWEWTQFTLWHNKISVADEALNGNFNVLKQKHKEHMINQKVDSAEWIGYRRLFRSSDKWIIHPKYAPALIIDRLVDHKNWLKKNPDIHVIQIVRKNKIEWLKSMYLSKKLQSYIGKEYPRETKIDVPIIRAIKRLKTKQHIDSELSKIKRYNPHLLVEYEKFLDYPAETLNEIMDFLNCRHIKIKNKKGKIKKQSTMLAKNYIKNYDRLVNKVESLFN
jgi:hypothetical protein